MFADVPRGDGEPGVGPGTYIWRDPFGAHYLVDHTGTRRLGQHEEVA
jgi:hypothetical protein